MSFYFKRTTVLLKTIIWGFYYFMMSQHQELLQVIFEGGAVCIKIVQWLSQRSDIIGKDCQSILSKVCSDVPSHDFTYTQKLLEKYKLTSDLTNIKKKVLGSGSIAQVYRAKYKNKDCIIKVQHPSITRQMETDIRIIKDFIRIMETFGVVIFKTMTISSTLDNIFTQCDFRNEARNTQEFRECFLSNPDIHFPEIYFKSKQILVESYMKGHHMGKFAKLYPKQVVKAKTITLAAYLQMFLVNGLIHADCHYGNIKFNYNVSSKRLSVYFLDCGVATHLKKTHQDKLIKLMNTLVSNPKKLANILVELSSSQIDVEKFNYLFMQKTKILQKNSRNKNSTLGKSIQMLLEVLGEVNACIDADIISFLIGYALIEGDKGSVNLTQHAIKLILEDKKFKATKSKASKMKEAIHCLHRL